MQKCELVALSLLHLNLSGADLFAQPLSARTKTDQTQPINAMWRTRLQRCASGSKLRSILNDSNAALD